MICTSAKIWIISLEEYTDLSIKMAQFATPWFRLFM